MELVYRKVRFLDKKIEFFFSIFFFFIIGSPYRERFSEIILDLQEKGLVSKKRKEK